MANLNQAGKNISLDLGLGKGQGQNYLPAATAPARGDFVTPDTDTDDRKQKLASTGDPLTGLCEADSFAHGDGNTYIKVDDNFAHRFIITTDYMDAGRLS